MKPKKYLEPLVLCSMLLLLPVAAMARRHQDPPPKIRIAIDDSAVRQLITMIEAKDTSDASIENWLSLPANTYLLKIGAQENNLTRTQLKTNVLAVINGTATRATQPLDDMGCVLVDPQSDYKRMLDDLQTSSATRIARITTRDAQFSPSKTDVIETVYLHLGGDWDAINANGSIYVNIRYWHDYYRPSWEGLNMIIAHETMHTIQNAAYGNPEVQDSADGAFLTALSKIQREGTARYVEYDTDPSSYSPITYGFFYRAVDAERLRAFPEDLALLQKLYDACYPSFNHDLFVETFQMGVNNGGPYYDIGHGIAKAIDEKLGRRALIDTVKNGPKDFFGRYITLCAKDSNLPALPIDVARQIGMMKDKL